MSRGTIARTISEARASLKDPTRPMTPAAITRARNLLQAETTTKVTPDQRLEAELRRVDLGTDPEAVASALAPWIRENAFNFDPGSPGRLNVLQRLQQFLDDHRPVFRLVVARDLLILLAGSSFPRDGPFVVAACRALLQLSQVPAHDDLFFQRGVISPLVDLLAKAAQRAPKKRESLPTTESLVYAAGTLKNLSNNDSRIPELGSKVACILCDVARAFSSTGRQADLLAQLTGALRNLGAASSQVRRLEAAKAATAVAALLRPYSNHPEVQFNAARALGKLSLYASLRDQLSAEPQLVLETFAALQRAQLEQRDAVVVRLGFVLGNLTTDDDRNRKLFDVRELSDVLQIAVDAFLRETPRTPEDDEEMEEQVLVKLARLAANVAIHPPSGAALARGPGGAALADLLGAVKTSEELVLNVVSAVTNLSYYIEAERRGLFLRTPAVISHLVDVLVHEKNVEAVLEAARALGNFSRDAASRMAMRDNRADEALVLLLNHSHRDVVYSAAGALVNIAADPSTNGILLRPDLEGAVNIVDLLRRTGLRDLPITTIAAKALHNLLLKRSLDPPTAAKLHSTLDDLIDAADDAIDVGSCSNEYRDFLDVATTLFRILHDRS